MRTRMLMLGLVASLSGAGGCGTLFKQAYHSVRGAQGKYYEIEVVDSEVLATYKSIRVESFTNELGDCVPRDVVFEVNSDTPTQIDEKHLFYPEGKQLIVTGRIIHFTGRSALKGAVGSIISGGESCVCRVQLKDADSGEQIGEAVCWGEVKSAIRRGSGEFGVGVGKGVAEWISDRFSKEELTARQEALDEGENDDDG